MRTRNGSTSVVQTLALALLIGALAAPLAAQQTPASSGAAMTSQSLDAAVSRHESVSDGQRAQLSNLLDRADVQDIARAHGLDLEQVRANSAVLTDAEVNEVAPLAARAMAAVQNGGTITISAISLIIILLLVLILTK